MRRGGFVGVICDDSCFVNSQLVGLVDKNTGIAVLLCQRTSWKWKTCLPQKGKRFHKQTLNEKTHCIGFEITV